LGYRIRVRDLVSVLVWVWIVGAGFRIRFGSGIRVSVLGFRLVSKAHRLLYHSTLGLRVIKKKKKFTASPKNSSATPVTCPHLLLLLYYSQA